MNSKEKPIYEFGSFRLDSAQRALLSDKGEPVTLTPKNLETLLALVENRGRVLEKEELIQRLWPDSVVEENNLTQNISALRKALGERPNEQRYIKTIPGRGYRFVADVRELAGEPEEPAIAPELIVNTVTEEEEKPEDVQAAVSSAIAGMRVRHRARWWKLAAAALLLAIPLVGLSYWRGRELQPMAEPQIHSLAVMPFKTLNPQPGEQYLGVGLADVMITRLSNLSQLTVRPTSSVLPFSDQDALQAGQALKVDSVLDGSIQKIGDKVRVTVRLLRTSDGKPLWAYQCDQQCTDIFTLQDKVSALVTEGLALRLTGEEKRRMTRRYTENVAAYQEYLKGRFHTLQYTPEGNRKAVEELNEALRLDPTYALAYAGLADAYTAASDWLLPPREALSKARAAAEKALALDDTLAEAHAALGHVMLHRFEPTAEKELQRALELNPNSVTALLWYGEYFMNKDLTKGLAVLRRAQQLDPLSPIIGTFISCSYLGARQFDAALQEARKTVEMDPNNPFSRGMLAWAYSAKGNYAEAIAEAEKLKQQIPTSQMMGALGMYYALAGRRDDALKILAEMDQMAKQQYVSPFDVAVIYAALGDKDQAFARLEKARQDESEWIGWINSDSRLDNLRSDPRFAELVRRVGVVR